MLPESIPTKPLSDFELDAIATRLLDARCKYSEVWDYDDLLQYLIAAGQDLTTLYGECQRLRVENAELKAKP